MSLPLFRSGPEVLFDVEPLQRVGDEARLSMPVGSWCALPDGRIGAGALGVVVDDALAMVLIDRRPPDTWSVSTEIAIDVFSGLGAAAGRLRVDATAVDTDPVGGYATGVVRDEAGAVVAVATQRGRFITSDVPAYDTGDALEQVPRAGDMTALVGLRVTEGGWELPVDAPVQNPMGRLHGGVAIAVADLVASAALETDAGPTLATNGVRMQYRRAVPGGVVLRLRPTIEHRGRTLAFVRVDGVVDDRVYISALVSAGPAQT